MGGKKTLEMIESLQNPKVKQWKKLLTKKGRMKEGKFLIEGIHLIEEALKAQLPIQNFIIDKNKEIPREWLASNIEPIYVSSRIMKEICETETPQGYVAISSFPDNQNLALDKGMFLFIDQVQDPGNVGTMIRTADAAGLTGVIIGEGTVDPLNGKVLRATQGSIFHIPVVQMDLEEAIERCKENNVPVFGTSIQGSTYTIIEPRKDFALIMGNEGSGVRKSILEKCDQNLYIPIYGKAESLNVSVATGILLYHLRG